MNLVAQDLIPLQAVYLLANLINGSESQQNQIASYPNLLTNLRTCLAEGKLDVKKPATSCIRQLAHNPKGRRAIIEAGITSTLRHLCEWSGSGISSASLSSPISAGSPVSGIGGNMASGGRNWGSSASSSTGGGHVPGVGWTGTSHPHHHHPQGIYHTHHPTPGIYQPHSAAYQHGTAMEDDREVVQNARAALDWLERGDTFV